MDPELRELLRRLRASGSGDGQRDAPNDSPLPAHLADPRSFRDTLSAILARPLQQHSVPLPSGVAGMATPMTPQTVFTAPEFEDNRFILSHELGHLVDFADVTDEETIKNAFPDLSEGERDRAVVGRFLRELGHSAGLRGDPTKSEQFADLFADAVEDVSSGRTPDQGLSPKMEEALSSLTDFIRERLAQANRRRRAQARVLPDATAVRR